MKKSETSVYEILRNKIITLEYLPGQELNINSIAADLGVSRSPIRDGLLHLELDKLVDIFPQKGTRVSFLNKEIVKQERFMRFNLELGVLKLFLETIKTETERKVICTKLKAILMQQHAAILSGDNKSFLQQDDNFHHFFYEETKNEWLWNVMKSQTGNDFRVRLLSYNSREIIADAEKDHNRILQAIELADNVLAIEEDKKHLQKVSLTLESMYSTFPEHFTS